AGVWNPGFVGVWHLKELPAGAPGEIRDSTANGNQGTASGGMGSANQTSGKVDGSLSFNGTSQYLNMGTASSLNTGDTLTVEAWVLPAGCDQLHPRPVVYGERSADAPGRYQLELCYGNGGSNRVAVTTSGQWNAATGDNVISLNVWQHVAYTRDASV